MSVITRMQESALRECEVEIRAACHRPIDQAALETLLGWVRPNFERILGHPDGAKRWAYVGSRMRDNGRYIGAFAEFFAGPGTPTIGLEELTRAFQVVRADCTVRAESTPLAYEFCYPPPKGLENNAVGEEFIRAVAPVPEPV
jgi:hypothetical protein